MPNPNTKGISVHVDRELHAEITAYLQENNMKMGDFIAMAAQELLRPPSMDIDPELKAEIDTYLEENNVTMAEFFAQAAQSQLHPHIPGIGSKLQAEINAYLEEHDMAMDEFMAIAARDELQPKPSEVEVKSVGNTRTLAFQVPEELFLRIKDYLKRNGMASLESSQERMKAVNAYYRKHKTLDGCSCIPASIIESLKSDMANSWHPEDKPYPVDGGGAGKGRLFYDGGQ